MSSPSRYIVRLQKAEGTGYTGEFSEDGGNTWKSLGDVPRPRTYWRNFARERSYTLRVPRRTTQLV